MDNELKYQAEYALKRLSQSYRGLQTGYTGIAEAALKQIIGLRDAMRVTDSRDAARRAENAIFITRDMIRAANERDMQKANQLYTGAVKEMQAVVAALNGNATRTRRVKSAAAIEEIDKAISVVGQLDRMMAANADPEQLQEYAAGAAELVKKALKFLQRRSADPASTRLLGQAYRNLTTFDIDADAALDALRRAKRAIAALPPSDRRATRTRRVKAGLGSERYQAVEWRLQGIESTLNTFRPNIMGGSGKEIIRDCLRDVQWVRGVLQNGGSYRPSAMSAISAELDKCAGALRVLYAHGDRPSQSRSVEWPFAAARNSAQRARKLVQTHLIGGRADITV